MKNYILSIVFLLAMYNCQNTPTASITLSVLADKTEVLIPDPTFLQITSFFKDKKYQEGVRHFYYQTITNTNINTSFHTSIPASDMFENSLQRKVLVQKFYERIDTLVNTQNRQPKNYQSSSILKPLIRECIRIQETNSTRRVILLYSDILEASDLFNVYQKRSQQLLFSNPEKVVEILEAQLTIPKLNDIELHIIYYPKNRLHNRLFEKMTTVYKQLFKDSGLKIIIGIDHQIAI
jgi:hypothetical protein